MTQRVAATRVAIGVDEAWSIVSELTRGQLAGKAIITTDVAEPAYPGHALSQVGKRGWVVVTAIGHPDDQKADLSLFELTLYEKQYTEPCWGRATPGWTSRRSSVTASKGSCSWMN